MERRLPINTHTYTENLNHSYQHLEGIQGVELLLHLFLSSKQDGGVLRDSHVPGDKTPGTILGEGAGWAPQSVWTFWKTEHFCTCRDSKHRSSSRYTVYVTRLPTHTHTVHTYKHA